MKDKLGQFIDDHRDAFDDKNPPEKVWKQIESGLNGSEKNKQPIAQWIKWSIGIAASFIIGIVLYFNIVKNSDDTRHIVSTDKQEVIDATEVNQFAKMIVLKQEELKKLAIVEPALYKKFTADITQLDSSYNALKTQLDGTPNKEMLVEAMIQNLQLQLNVLNQQLHIIKEIKQSKKYSHEKSYQDI